VVFAADSEAQIVRGLVALLVRVYSGATPDEIIEAAPTFIHELGLGDNLTMNRVNGLGAMVKQMKFYALGYKAILARGQ
jgi:cysteine desulfuration protein SufE